MQYAPPTIVRLVDYPDLCVCLFLVFSDVYFLSIKFDSLETLYACHCYHYFHKYAIFPNSRAKTEHAPTLNITLLPSPTITWVRDASLHKFFGAPPPPLTPQY